MKTDINLLILDEPTNHLDIASREWIEQALTEYEGTLLFVSHDRWFVDSFATRVWELKKGELSDFRGGYEEYREYKERQTVLVRTAKKREEKPPKPRKPQDISKQLQKIEKQIEKLEEKIAALSAEEEANASDYVKLMELGEAKAAAESELEALYEQWEALSDG